MLSVRFWGTRGSIPCPGPSTIVFGGNTSCLEIRADERLIVVDLGTGARLLGEFLVANDCKNRPVDADIFITHTHWDHIIGFPLFTPLFIPTTKLRLWGPVSAENKTLESILKTQLDYQFWPIRMSELSAKMDFAELQETTVDLGDGLIVKTKYLNHPVLCLGYRFEYQGKSIVTAYDHEPFRNLFPTDTTSPSYDKDVAQEGELTALEENEKTAEFFKDADVLIHDSQYTEKEYNNGKQGWGHTTYEYAVSMAQKANVRQLVLFHHDPNHTDAMLEQFEQEYQPTPAKGLLNRAKTLGKSLNVVMAREGITVEA
ncbi:MAG: MBL fold metallo-hydrolase [Treponema sp.]|jgi:phosphoribosyl 1,2-cyclic phosphodiesterase|nr:MBL fold metallo-hydrolase [Treponema sp.]